MLNFHSRLELILELSDDISIIPFGQLMPQTKYCKCTNDRDLVYALSGFLQEAEREMGNVPDRREDKKQRFIQVSSSA